MEARLERIYELRLPALTGPALYNFFIYIYLHVAARLIAQDPRPVLMNRRAWRAGCLPIHFFDSVHKKRGRTRQISSDFGSAGH